MTHGQLITRLCKIRDDLTETVVQLKDAPSEWVKEEPDGCEFCQKGKPMLESGDGCLLRIYRDTDGGYYLAVLGWYAPIAFCPMCGRDLRET